MNDSPNFLDLIPYDEMALILKKEFNANPEEIRYWVKRAMIPEDSSIKQRILDIDCGILSNFKFNETLLCPYQSDIPLGGYYLYPDDNFFYPECCFYDKQNVLNYIPPLHLRFVYLKDLPGKRNWNDYKSSNSKSMIYQNLLSANEKGILRLYHPILDEFTTHANDLQLWCHTFEGEEAFSNPETFFLLYEIINIERIFFKKDKNICLEELQLFPSNLPPNVYKFKKKPTPLKENDND